LAVKSGDREKIARCSKTAIHALASFSKDAYVVAGLPPG
jgi:hypothetical protein